MAEDERTVTLTRDQWEDVLTAIRIAQQHAPLNQWGQPRDFMRWERLYDRIGYDQIGPRREAPHSRPVYP